MRIGFLMQNGVPDLNGGSGPSVHVRAVIQHLQKRGHQVRMIVRDGRMILWTDDLIHYQEIRCNITHSSAFKFIESGLRHVQAALELPFLGLFDSLRFAEACCRSLRDFDILYERHEFMAFGGVVAARCLRIPLVLEVNGEHFHEMKMLGIQLSRLQSSISQMIAGGVLRSAALIVATGFGWKRRIEECWGINGNRVRVILNGTNVDLYAAHYDEQQVRQRFRIRPGKIIIYVGGFQIWQGVDVLIRALCQVLPVCPDARLVLVGDGPEKESVMALADRLSVTHAINALGWLVPSDVAAVMSIADVAAAPYKGWSEMVGMKTADYMASGRAIVTSAQDKKHSLIEHGRTGVLVEPGQVEPLAQAIIQLLQDDALRLRLGQAAQRQARAALSWDHTTAQIEDVCNDVISRRRRGRSPQEQV
jgi:glycosyltransferase involved in cell wall biosynthesis